jgi:hypothetical protein
MPVCGLPKIEIHLSFFLTTIELLLDLWHLRVSTKMYQLAGNKVKLNC